MNLHVLSSYPFRNHPCKAHLTAITQVINRSRHTRNNAPSSSRSTASLQDISPATPPSHADTADENDPPAPGPPAKGCHFHPRCPHAMAVCREKYPEATQLCGSWWVLCFLFGVCVFFLVFWRCVVFFLGVFG